MRRAETSPPDISPLLPSDINRMALLRLARIRSIGRGRSFLDNIPSRRHCFGAAPFLNFTSAREAGRLRSGGVYVMTAMEIG
ncbi:hypothetical protein [Streptomyces sp. NBC_00691]|uniref:hypothetical protein n=1 Tax=Streptomyces sp. NBC_00691 TaxID=2903671 RepID=UPI002E304BF1|nr:hypothetical protein [Streptomyces sp. NBC_00691]